LQGLENTPLPLWRGKYQPLSFGGKYEKEEENTEKNVKEKLKSLKTKGKLK
jgi:hypothetical protein